MSQSKKSYFQGGGGINEPTPKKKKYKSDKAIVVQPRFKEPLFKNYDLYETEGKHTPGAGFYQNMDKYKSVKEFIDKKRKVNKDKYKADDSWIEDTEANKKERINKMKTRANLLSKITKLAIDFPIDDQIHSDPILGDSGTYSDSVPIGGATDEYLTQPDFEGKLPTELDFGRDYTDESENNNSDDLDEPKMNLEKLEKLMEKYISQSGTDDLYGLPDGVNSVDEDLGNPSNINPEYGTTDHGTNIYDKMWI